MSQGFIGRILTRASLAAVLGASGCAGLGGANPAGGVPRWLANAQTQREDAIQRRAFVIAAGPLSDTFIRGVDPDSLWQPLSSRQLVPIPSMLRTGSGSSLTMLVGAPDGAARIVLEPNTEVFIAQNVDGGNSLKILNLHLRRGAVILNARFSESGDWKTLSLVESTNVSVGGRTPNHDSKLRDDGTVWLASGELVLVDRRVGWIHDVILRSGDGYNPGTHLPTRPPANQLDAILGND